VLLKWLLHDITYKHGPFKVAWFEVLLSLGPISLQFDFTTPSSVKEEKEEVRVLCQFFLQKSGGNDE